MKTHTSNPTWQAFKQHKRGWFALRVLAVLFAVALLAPLWSNDKPLLIRYQGEYYFPLVNEYNETVFGGDFDHALIAHLVDGVRILRRVVPAHSFKFAATLQQAQGGTAPILIRIDSKAGHGGGKPLSKQIEEQADIYSFILANMGK